LIWADGVYSGLRAEQAKLCALVIIGVNERGEKHFLAIEDGVRESPFGAIRHRTKCSKGCLFRDGVLHMMFKLSQCAELNCHRLRGFNSLAKVIEGVPFKDGIEINKPDQVAA